MNGVAIATAIAHVGQEVLGGGDDAHLLELRDVGNAHCRGEKRVFAVGFLGAPPANVAGDVYHRRKNLP